MSYVNLGLGFHWGKILTYLLSVTLRLIALLMLPLLGQGSGIGFLMFDARRAGSVVEIFLGMIILGILWYIVDSWILAPIERATGQRWGLVTK